MGKYLLDDGTRWGEGGGVCDVTQPPGSDVKRDFSFAPKYLGKLTALNQTFVLHFHKQL